MLLEAQQLGQDRGGLHSQGRMYPVPDCPHGTRRETEIKEIGLPQSLLTPAPGSPLQSTSCSLSPDFTQPRAEH